MVVRISRIRSVPMRARVRCGVDGARWRLDRGTTLLGGEVVAQAGHGGHPQVEVGELAAPDMLFGPRPPGAPSRSRMMSSGWRRANSTCQPISASSGSCRRRRRPRFSASLSSSSEMCVACLRTSCLPAKCLVEGRTGDAAGGPDVVDRDAVEPALCEQARRDVEDLLGATHVDIVRSDA